MNSCGPDFDLINSLVDSRLLKRIPELKELMCCEGGGTPTPPTPNPPTPPATDTFINKVEFEAHPELIDFYMMVDVVEHQLRLYRNDGTTFNVNIPVAKPTPPDLSYRPAFEGVKVEEQRDNNGVVTGHKLIFRRIRGDTEEVVIPEYIGGGGTGADNYVTRGELVNGTTLRLHRNDGGQVDVDVSSLAVTDLYVEKGETRILGNPVGKPNATELVWLDLTRNDGSVVSVDITGLYRQLAQHTLLAFRDYAYNIVTVDDDYTIEDSSFLNHTIIRANRNGDQTITIPKPPDAAPSGFVGHSMIIRKTNGAVGTFVTLKAGDGVKLIPEDASPLRRVGSSVTLVYIGDGVYEVFGELP